MGRTILIGGATLLGSCNALIGVDEFRTGSEVPDAAPSDGSTVDAMPPPEIAARYVIADITIPTSNSEAMALGRDLDDDGVVDNQLGSIFAALQGAGAEVLTAFGADAAIASGEAIWLHELYAYELVDSAAAWWASYDGQPEATPDYSGNGVFAVDGTAPTEGRIDGTIVDGAFVGERGTGRFVLGFGTGVVRVDLRAAEVAATATANGCDGVVAGGIPDTDVQDRIIPAMASAAQQVVADDPGCPASCGGTATSMLDVFDANDDGTITTMEVAENSLIMSLMVSDLDTDGDGEADALSVGVGVTCVRASFATP